VPQNMKMPPSFSSPIFVLSLLLLLLGAVATQSEVSTPFFEEDVQLSVSPDNNQRLSPFDEAVQPKQNEETQAHGHPMPETIGVSPLSSWSSWLRTIFTNALGLPGFDINAHVADQPCSGSSQALAASECLAWQAFFDSTGGGGCLRDDPCECEDPDPDFFDGVVCQDGHITDIDLSDTQMSGTIPDSISALTALTNLQLTKKYISGTIPGSISALTALTGLYLSDTSISGSIPDSISALTALTGLLLENQENPEGTGIIGTIPQSFCSLDLSKICQLTYLPVQTYACPLPSCTDKLTACSVVSCK